MKNSRESKKTGFLISTVLLGFLNATAAGQDLSKSQFAVVRYNYDGSLDKSFGNNGKVLIDFAASEDEIAHAVTMDQNNKIVVVGEADGKFALARLEQNGVLDKDFGGNGKVTTEGTGRANAVTMDENNKIVAAGGTGSHFALARYNKDGSLDASFGGNGTRIIVFKSLYLDGLGSASGVAIDPNNNIVVAGTVIDQFDFPNRFALARLRKNGDLDASFGGNGKVQTDIEPISISEAKSMAIDEDGKIILAGWVLLYGKDGTLTVRFVLARYNNDGGLDASFGNNGKVITNFGVSSEDMINAVAIDKNLTATSEKHKIVVAGIANDHFALARYHNDGSLDQSFGKDGRIRTNFDVDSEAKALVFQKVPGPQNFFKPVAVGNASGIALARYNHDGSLDASFGGNGKVKIGGIVANAVTIDQNNKIVVAGWE